MAARALQPMTSKMCACVRDLAVTDAALFIYPSERACATQTLQPLLDRSQFLRCTGRLDRPRRIPLAERLTEPGLAYRSALHRDDMPDKNKRA